MNLLGVDMGAKQPDYWSLECEICGRGGQLYKIVHPDPTCEDWIACHFCKDKILIIQEVI